MQILSYSREASSLDGQVASQSRQFDKRKKHRIVICHRLDPILREILTEKPRWHHSMIPEYCRAARAVATWIPETSGGHVSDRNFPIRASWIPHLPDMNLVKPSVDRFTCSQKKLHS